jgi:hypothetical protein
MSTDTRSCPDCGFTGTYGSAKLADAFLARHSCDRHRRRLTANQARAARAAGGPRRDCQHPGCPHQHGTRPAYVRDQCHCIKCRAANAAASRGRNRDRAYGRWAPYVPADAVRAHIAALRAAGIGRLQIAALSGVDASHLRVIANGRAGRLQQRVRAHTAARVLAVQADEANQAPNCTIDATGTRRRLQAMVALGWPLAWLAERLGRHSTNLRRSLSSEQVSVRTAADVAELYEQLWNTRTSPDTNRGRRAIAAALALATEYDWLTPLAWDDIDHDPTPPLPPRSAAGEVDEIAVELAITGRSVRLTQLTPAEQEEAVRRLTEEHGKSVRDIAEQLATSTRTISRRRRTSAA